MKPKGNNSTVGQDSNGEAGLRHLFAAEPRLIVAADMTEPKPGFLSSASAALAASGIHLREAMPEDLPLLADIYATTREEELQQVSWNPEQKKAFTDWQSAQQEQHYALHYPRAERLLIEQQHASGRPGATPVAIGRIYLETTRLEVRLMDITLFPAYRNRGLGTRVMNALLCYADALPRQMSLHVEPFNPAKRMYERMGFVVSETRGLYEFMFRVVPPGAAR